MKATLHHNQKSHRLYCQGRIDFSIWSRGAFPGLSVRLIALIGFFLLAATESHSQTTLNGMIRDGTDKPLPFASVALLNAVDSSLAKGTASDQQGLYTFENVRTGRYVVRATAVGYQKTHSTVVDVTTGVTTVPPLALSEVSSKLAEVQVTAKKPFVEQQIDRMVINVANSIVGSGSSALEVLEKTPGVTVDYQNERLQLRGKEGVIVQVDGKQTYLSAQDVIALLRSMSSDNIDKIELIMNPSARYDAAGNSGIINIRLKKNGNLGTNGTVSVAGGSGRFDRERGSLQLNHRTQKMNLFGNYSLNRGGNYWDFQLVRNQPDPSPSDAFRRNLVSQYSYLTFRDLGQNAKAGLDYSPTKTTTIGVVWTGFWSDHREKGPAGATFRRNTGGPVYLQTQTHKTYDVLSQNQVGNLNLQHAFGEKKGQLTMDVDLGHFTRQYTNSLLTETLVLTSGSEVQPPAGALLITQPSTVNIQTFKADYNRTLSNGWKLETGLKSAFVKTDNDLSLSSGPAGVLVPDPALSNHFQYTERVNAGYISFSGQLGRGDGPKTEIQAGLRAEHTHSEGNSLTLNQIVARDYLKWFPSLFVSRALSPNQTLTFSYSYRIDRPNYQNLNPARGYVDPYAYSQGNAYLKPQFTHALEGKLSFKNGIFTSLGANYTTDLMFFTIHATEGNKTYVTMENLGRSQGYIGTLSWPVTVMKGWQLQTNVLGYYNRFRYHYEGTILQIENVAGRLNGNNAFTLGHGWTAELNGWVSSPAVNGIWTSPWLGALDTGIQKAVSSDLKLKFSVQDVFHTNRFRPSVNTPMANQKGVLTFDTRIALLNLTYSFGNQQVKAARQRRSGSDDEIRRTN
ncbi:outer membrane beta-barrel protein [Larkinella humicola]|uniref:TonB-dependent receptor n=1 Tax=Larkinella humicola TaxID=2607654 RepID=A0A5N1JD67_9BACT|nr:outer membrane beta-barrel protein [Larkinella humicola]KAA9347182.1 TonB-dependent receptor [Larkinella humicola]